MKKSIMQKMAANYKSIHLFVVLALFCLALFGCISNSENQSGEQTQKTDESVNQANNLQDKKDPNIIEGLVPPADQNILLAYYVQAGDNLAKIGKKIYGEKTAWKKTC